MFVFPEKEEALEKATLLRRLAAMFYDSLLCIALLMVTTGVYMMIQKAVIGSEAYKAMNDAGQTIHDPLLSSVLFITLFLFFGYFWTRTGQTLGMQVWHIRVQTEEGTSIRWMQALMRFFMAGVSIACFGLGYVWMLFDKQDRTWHCIFSDTKIVRVPKRK
ncbi:MAG: RDD family protein [Oleiphilus sp.]|nr:MAG: RDD family protein [Oleiphilus sp.]